MIALEGVTARFGGFRLGPLFLSVPRGAYCVLLGPSGAGKSLLLQLVAGLHFGDSGKVVLGERDLTRAPPEHRGVGIVFQQSALFPHLSVAANLEYGLVVRGVSTTARRARVEQLVHSLDLGPLLSLPVATLSGGEAQRVAMGRVLATDPSVLLLDEPLGPLDHNARASLQAELMRVHQLFKLTTLHVTHSREEAQALADQCAIMQGGRIVQVGSKEEVFSHPRCAFVAEFLGLDGRGVQLAPACKQGCKTGSCDLPMPKAESV